MLVLLMHAFFLGGGPREAPMTSTSERVKAVTGHMATSLENGEDSDLAPYLPPVLSRPVVQIAQRMITGEIELSNSYAGTVLPRHQPYGWLGSCMFATLHFTLGFHMSKLHLGYEACLSVRLLY